MARYSLTYYESLFPEKGPAYDELIEALAQELEDYAREVTEVASQGWGGSDLARVRHSHRPTVENLGLEALASLEVRLMSAPAFPSRDGGSVVQAFVDEARALARELRSELRSELPSD